VYVFVGPIVAIQFRKLRPLAIAACLFLALALPTYVLVFSFTGNPVFPLMNGVFKSPKWSATNAIMNAAEFGSPVSFGNLIRFPFRLTLDTVRFGEVSMRGSLGLTPLLALPFVALLLRRSRAPFRYVVIAAAGALLLIFVTMQYARYVVPVLPLLAVAGAATVFHVLGGGFAPFARIAVLVVVVMQPLVDSPQYFHIPERYPVKVALGLEGPDAFLGRALTGYGAAMYLNRVTMPGDKVLGIGSEQLRFRLRAELITPTLVLATDPVRRAEMLPPNDELRRHLKQLGITHVLFERDIAENPPPWYPYVSREFLQSQTRLAYRDGQMFVYRLM
jgi:hypothetical protein